MKSHKHPWNKSNNANTIFVITAIEDIELGANDKACFGWFSSWDAARDAVLKNKCDIRECLYNYVVIEEVPEGIQSCSINEWWFKWNKDNRSYVAIDKPKETQGIINWGI